MAKIDRQTLKARTLDSFNFSRPLATPILDCVSSAFFSFTAISKRFLLYLSLQLIRGYQLTISPLIGPRCRFYPSCSSYALEALQTHGLRAGVRLTFLRIIRCHPGCPGGIDNVPANPHQATSNKPSEKNSAEKNTCNAQLKCDTGADKKHSIAHHA